MPDTPARYKEKDGGEIARDSEDDLTFQPPALSSYAMSLLNDINNKKSHLSLKFADTTTSEAKLYNFQPRLSSIMTTGFENKRYSSTNERTTTTMDSKRTSVGHHTTTPYTEMFPDANEEDKMEISPINQRAQVHFDVDQRPSTPLSSQKHRKTPTSISRLSLLDPTRSSRSQRRFARVSLGAPKRVSKQEAEQVGLDVEPLVKESVDPQSLDWIEEEKEKIRMKNREIMLRLSISEEKLEEVVDSIAPEKWYTAERFHRDEANELKTEKWDRKREEIHPTKISEFEFERNKENIRQDHSLPKIVHGKRTVLSSISPNIDNRRHTPKESKPEPSPLRRSPDSSHTTAVINVNDRTYEKLELIGKGGTSKVYKLKLTSNGKVFAIKRVTFDEFDESAIMGFRGEIDLLKKLSTERRVVKLVDYAMNERSLMLVMECGDIDLAHVLTSRMNLPLDIAFVRYHMIEVLKCVAAVHDAGVIHSDLKPANFIFVKGVLKIIDFGIANALSDHTMNIYRESQIGTPNYMSPESLLEVHPVAPKLEDKSIGVTSNSTWKVGRLSDVWSCGCIMYQMIYGRPPYASYSGNQRLLAIMNPQVKILYPETGLGDVRVPKTAIDAMQSCLQREPSKRRTIEQVLNGPFCQPKNVSKEFIEDLVTNAINFGAKNGDISKESLKILTSEVWSKIEELHL